MPEYHLATRVGTITFEIEQDPEGSELYGVWERMAEEPESDEIVKAFPTHEAAEAWIRTTLALDSDVYLRARGIIP